MHLLPEYVHVADRADPHSIENLKTTLADLRRHLGSAPEVAARLVDAHGPRIRVGLQPWRGLPEVAACFGPFRKGRAPAVLAEARDLIHRDGQRRAAVTLARLFGLAVFDTLNAHARDPEIRGLLGVAPRRARHRPKGSTSRDREAYALVVIHDDLWIPRAAILRALGRSPASTTGQWPDKREAGDWKWLRRRLERGRVLRQHLRGANGSDTRSWSPDISLLTFIDGYHVRGARNQGEILDALCPLLVAAMRPPIDVPHGAAIFKALRARASDKGPMTVEQRNLVRTAIAEILRERLKLALPTSHR